MGASDGLFHKAREGLVGAEHWSAPLEGAFTRVAKIAILNALPARPLCELLFGRRLVNSSYGPIHGRSFVSSGWVKREGLSEAGTWALGGFLERQCGRWAPRVASDQRLRLCRHCADTGFQAAIFQIDAVTTCPIHDEPLIDCCPHCSAPTPPYALTVESFETPMQCGHCGQGYGRAWSGAVQLEDWCGPADIEPLRALARSLTTIREAELEWPLISTWVPDPMAARPEASGRRAVFRALLASLDPGATGTTEANLSRDMPSLTTKAGSAEEGREECAGEPTQSRRQSPQNEVRVMHFPCENESVPDFGQRIELEQRRTAIYKSIRRRVMRVLRLRPQLRTFNFDTSFFLHRASEAVVPKSRECPPALHALALWMHRFERRESSPLNRWSTRRGLNDRGLTLHWRMLRWPADQVASDAAWGHFVWGSFQEDLWTASQWSGLTYELDDPFEREHEEPVSDDLKGRRTAFLDLLRVWTPRLSSLAQPWSSGMTHFLWREGQTGATRLTLVTINRQGVNP
jgi:hypothetical protein